MSCLHVTACQFAHSPLAFRRRAFQVNELSRLPSTYLESKLPKTSLKLTSATSRYQRLAPICLFGGKGELGDANEASPWKSLEKAIGNFKKEQSIEDVLKQQIQKQEYYDGGAGGGGGGSGGDDDDGKRPAGGGGGGFGEADEEGLSGMWDEFTQVMFATIGFIFLYIYIIETEEITVLARDLIKLLLTRQMSLRLMRIVNEWTKFFQRLTEKEEVDPYWLERAIINTPTMYDSPDKYKRIINKAYMDLRSDDEGFPYDE